jgi:hypothetical protein
MSELTYFERRRIQMEFSVPLIKDLSEILGADVVKNALEERNRRMEERSRRDREPDFSRMAEGTKAFADGGALEYEIIADTSDSFDMNVHQCRYAEMMEELGGREFGHLLICNGDFAAAGAIGMKLSRSQTRMQGADFCDFRYRSAGEENRKSGG